MLVRVEKTPQIPVWPMRVRVHSSVGTAVVSWRGDPQKADGRHYVEWTVDEDIGWGWNTQSAAVAEPGLRQDGDCIVLRGRLDLTDDGSGVLEMGDSQILLDLAAPVPKEIDGAWVEIRVPENSVAIWPFLL